MSKQNYFTDIISQDIREPQCYKPKKFIQLFKHEYCVKNHARNTKSKK